MQDELILQHLSFKELINLTLISPSWNFIIENTNCFKKKVKFCIRDFGSPEKLRSGTEKLSKSSVRKYENFQINSQNLGFPSIPEAKFLARNEWKRVEIFVHYFTSTINYEKYLGFFEPSVVELELRSAHPFTKIREPNETLRFRNLRSLKIFNATSSTIEPFIQSPKLLHTLSLVNIKQSASAQSMPLVKMIPQLVGQQINLVFLELNEPLVDAFFDNPDRLTNMHNLKTLIVEEPKSIEACRKVQMFIVRCGESLEILKLNNWSNTSTFYHIADDMEKLKEFHQSCNRLNMKFDDTLSLMKLQSVKSMTELTFAFSSTGIPQSWLKPILNAVQNLSSLVLQQVSLPTIELVSDSIDHCSRWLPPNLERCVIWEKRDSDRYKSFFDPESSFEEAETQDNSDDVDNSYLTFDESDFYETQESEYDEDSENSANSNFALY